MIREFEEKDQAKLKELLMLNYEEAYFLNILSSPQLKYAFVSISYEKVVGFIFAWHSSFHPYCTYFKMVIHPQYEFEMIAKKLLEKLEQRPNLIEPLQTLVNQDAKQYCNYFKYNHFKEVRKTYLPLISIQFKSLIESSSPNHIVKTLIDIHTDKHNLESFAHLVKRNYEETHRDNPVAENVISIWESLILADDIIMEGSLLYVDKNTKDILAYSLLHESEETETLELGWCGSNTLQNIHLISELVSLQINFAENKDYRFILGECDTTNPYAMEVFNSFGAPECKTLITYRSVT